MEPYSMPQLDKSSPVYSEKQYEGDDTSNGRPTTGNAKKYIGVASEPLPLLTSSAWSAVIHHPAEDDSEPDDLPSTVDMDAIKGSPATPLAATSKLSSECWEKSKRRGGDGEEGSDSEGSDGDDDSDSSDDSDSASDSGSESGSCTWSESESGSTSCSSRSLSSQSSRVHQTFSIRETNIDQGGLKLKISALKVPRKIVAKEVNKPDTSVDDPLRSKAQADDVVSQEESELPQLSIKPTKNSQLPLKIDKSSLSEAKPKIDKVQSQVPSVSKIEKTGSPGVAKPEKILVPKVEKSLPANPSGTLKSEKSNNNDSPNASKPDKIPAPSGTPKDEKLRTTTPSKLVKNQPAVKDEKTQASPQNLSKSDSKNHAETKSKADKAGVVHKNPPSSVSKTCAPKTEPQCGSSTRTANSRASTRSETRKTDGRLPARHKPKVSSVTGGRGIYNMRVPGATPTGCTRGGGHAARAVTPQSATDTEEEGEEMSEMTQQLVGAEQESIAISEHLQVINQEDLAAILPDVITLGHQDDEVCTPFDGFEDVSSESGKAANRGVESSSDVELPEQVVSAAIQRIHLDGGQDSSSDGASCDDEAASTVGHPYSSSLLQQFVEKTKLLSSQASEKSTEVPKRRKRGRPPKSAKSKRVPEIEAYMQLDLSVSNVSPDSGIQSVAGSPPRRSVSPVLGPNNADNSPQSPSSENNSPNYATEDNRQKSKPKTSMSETRRGRGRPKGSVKKGKRLNSDFASGTDSCDEIPPAPSLSTTVKRGPGRPKKTTPNAEPTTTIDLKCDDEAQDESDHSMPVKKDILNIEKLFKSESKPHLKKKNSDIIKLTDKNTNSPKSYDGLVGGKQPKSSAILSEICERVSKRLDLPLHSVTSYPLKLTKVKLTKDSLRGGKLKRGRRKRELGEDSEREAKDKRRRRFSSSSPGSSHRDNGSRNHLNSAVKPASTPQVPAPRLLSLPHGVPHKHKKKKKKSKPVKAVRTPEDPALLTDLERLVHMFRRSCTIAIARNAASRNEGNLPSIFRVKRIGKKRKGSEKSRNSQLASLSDKESAGEGDGKEKEKSRQRRPKKSTVEPPKGHHERTEPANNEQRLPLKKRHYHMSLPPVPLASQDGQNADKTPPCEKITTGKILPGDGTRKSVSSERSTDKNVDKTTTKSEKCSTAPSKSSQAEVKVKSITETHRNSRNSVNSERIVEKANDKTVIKLEKNVNSSKVTQTDVKSKSQTEVPRKLATVESTRKSINSERTTEKAVDKVVIKAEKGANVSIKSGQAESKAKAVAELPRNSIDEAIEACITRYSTPPMITTPKKRHRLENAAVASPRNLSTQLVKAKDAEVTVTSRASAPPSKRATSRSASAATAANSPPPGSVETKPLDGIFEPSSKTINLDLPASLPTFLTRTALSNKPISPNNKSNLSSLATETLPPTTTDPSIASVATNSSKNSAPTKSASNSTPEKTICKPLTISIEQHSVENSGTSQNSNIISPKNKPPNKSLVKVNSPKVPSPMSKVNSPKSVDVLTEITSDVTPFHNLRLKRSNGTIVEETNSSKLVSKKKKLISADVRIQVTQISPAELMLNAKKKVRRRKAINRTGFPVKKKKKKKINLPAETVLTYEGEDCEALIPKSIISVINVTNDVSLKNAANDKASETVQPKHTNTRLSKSVDVTESKLGRTKNSNKCKEKISHLDRSITRVVKNNESNESERDRPNSRTEMEIDSSILEPEVLIYERTRKRKRESEVINDAKAVQPQFPPVSKRMRKCKEDVDTDSDVIVPEDVPSCDESTKSGPRKKQPRWRKKFLVAGLFSDYFKEDEPRRVGDAASKQRQTTYKPEEHKYGLLPPPYHCGRYLRQRKVEFKLPYDMWWQHLNSQLPGRDLVPSWNYKKIRTNVYYDVKPTYGYEAQACNCAPADVHSKVGCGDDCINRMVYTECASQLCPCKEVCSNQKIQRHEWAPGLDKFMTKDKGWGVRTKQLIKTGDFILEYVGEVVSEKEFKDRMASRYVHDTHHYCLNLDGGLVIDGHRMGGDGRFVNHSCEPNCEMQKWSVHGLFRMALFALRDVRPDEELSYDYNFSLFNPAEGQPCKCGSSHCRGVIGGKSQRLNGMPAADKGERRVVGRPRKNARKNSANIRIRSKKRAGGDISNKTPVKPMSHQQRCFAQLHHCFLLRNLEKVKRLRERLKDACRREQQVAAASANCTRPVPKHSDVFMAQLNALSCPRNMRTRRLAQAEDNPELTKTARLAYVFRDLYNIVIAAKDERNEMLATPFLTLPNKRKLPAYFQRITEPIDLSTLEQNIVTGFYRTVETFDTDMVRLFANNVRFFGRTSELGIVATRLKKVYNTAKMDFLLQLEEILGESPPPSFLPENDPGGEEEDVIRCICGLYKDEGTMIQCERCLVWQHCDCVRADKGVEHYLCEQCDGRVVDFEVKMEEIPSYATPGLEYYVTLLRGKLQLRQGDTVYVLRDMDEEGIPASQPPVKVTYKTVKEVKYTDLDIFRVERLWKDEKGDRFAFGHHFLRPHETYHEPSRKFFPNEVMRVPLYEVVPVELIMGRCWVLDANTFCKGRPVNAPEEHIYVCEYRVDKSAHLFTKIARPRYPTCTKTYAFDMFDAKVKPVRTYTPHGRVAPRTRGPRGPAPIAVPDVAPEDPAVPGTPHPEDKEEHIPLARRTSQKVRLNTILLQLLSRLPSKQPLDVSYLLEPGRRHRKKTSVLNT